MMPSELAAILPEVGVGGGDGRVDVEAQVARVHVGVELLDEAQIGRGGAFRETFEVQREAAIDRKCGEKANDLPAKRGALAWVGENGANRRVPGLGSGVVVVEVGKDFSIFLGRLNDVLDAVAVVGIVNGGAVDHGIFAMGVVVDGQQGGVGSVHMEPLGEEQIELVDVLLEGGVAGRVILDVIGGTQAFTSVEWDIGGLAGGFRRVGRALAPRNSRERSLRAL